ncbi:hypothetical protein KUTeg_010964, partial [Tegillarca granosa]
MAACSNDELPKSADDNRTIADDKTSTCPSVNDRNNRGEMWQLVGEFSTLNRKKCRHLYAKAGKRKDLALFYDESKFYAMEAWCSHMGPVFLVKFVYHLIPCIFSGGPLYLGDIEDYKGSCHVMCPWHSYMFDLATGKNEIGLR